MATIGSQCVDAIVTLLNDPTGRPTGLQPIVRGRLSPGTQKAGEHWIFVRSGMDEIEPMQNVSSSPLDDHRFRIIIDCIGTGDASTPADAAVDPLVAWCVKQLNGSTLGGLAVWVRRRGKQLFTYAQGDYPSCRAELRFEVRHLSRTDNAELKA
jgi:hypothetical protein